MKPILLATCLAALPLAAQQASMSTKQTTADPFLWLEEVTGDKALAWVRERNEESQRVLCADERFQQTYDRILTILDSTARIPYVALRGEHYYNFWQDAKNPRGLWRRTTPAQYELPEPSWEIVLDLDELSRREGENWVWRGASFLRPECRRCLLTLSRGGADAAVVREFDVVLKEFVVDGFVVPEAKSSVGWRDRDNLYVASDFGPGSTTASGYPRTARLWRRGTSLAEAPLVAEGRVEDVFLSVSRDQTKGFERDLVSRAITFFTNELLLLREGGQIRIDKPDSANASLHREWLLLELREPWDLGATSYKAGSLLAIRLEEFLAGKRDFAVLFAPGERSSLAGFAATRNHILLNVLDNVRNRISVLSPSGDGWQRQALPGLPEFGTIQVSAVDDELSDDYFLVLTDYLTPTSLWFGTVGKGEPKRLKSLPAFFDAGGLHVEQREALSDDGTAVPYFLVSKKDLERNGSNPTLLYGYGGFEVSMTPSYSAGVGTAWLSAGGVYVVANIRGGGEFGPRWHQAALKANRHKAYEDFAAVARDLIAQRITSPSQLACQGGSNGGLLVGNMLTRYPELFGAIVCQVPLLDMLRYHKLLAGASWIGEYGDPEIPEEATWLQRISPYHNLDKDRNYPRLLLMTSTRDDRVHPGHARKLMARMMQLEKPALYYENIEGGHGGAADNKQAAHMAALAYTFLWQTLRTADTK